MSGIVGICRVDGAPVSRALLEEMTLALEFRGPDGREIWVRESVGFGHALLRTTWESEGEIQPRSLDGQTWIVADARIDARESLIGEIRFHSGPVSDSVTDADLILRAWHLWREECVQHLLGDFAFGIWDGKRNRLFCARDHFGLKPFYYSLRDQTFVFSNTLNCVRIHPCVSSTLDDAAIADYLLFGYKKDHSLTSFRDIRRLPPAHTLTLSADGAAVKRYWSLSPEHRIRYRNPEDYLDRFNEMLHTAVADRLRTSRVAVFMSGGMDSSSVASIASEIAAQTQRTELRAFTVVDDHLCGDRERHYSGLVADALGLPVDYLVVDGYKPFQGWDDAAVRGSEPACSPFGAIACDQFREVQRYSRVALSGQGGDQVFLPAFGYFFNLLRRGRLVRLSAEAIRCIRILGRVPKFGFRTGLRNVFRKPAPPPLMAEWIRPEFARAMDLESRWRDSYAPSPAVHADRPEAFQRLTDSSLSLDFELNDPGETLTQVEVRCPLLDVRLVEFLLAIPPVPWNFDKGILRLAMRGRLPEAVRRRPKTPYPGDSLAAHLSRPGSEWIDDFRAHPMLERYVDRERIPRLAGPASAAPWTDIRPLAFSLWLNSISPGGTLTDTSESASRLGCPR